MDSWLQKSTIRFVLFLAAATLLGAPFFVFAQTVDSQATVNTLQAQIQALMVQIKNLQSQVNAASGGQVGGQSQPVSQLQPPSVPAQSVSIAEAPQNIPSFNRNLFFGIRGDDVRDLQEFLTDQGYYAGPISGYYGLLTVQAAKKFQSANGINPTGYFGPRSRAIASEIFRKLVSQICSEEGCEGNVLPVAKLTISTNSDLRGVVTEYFSAIFKMDGGSGDYSVSVDGYIPGLNFVPSTKDGKNPMLFGNPTKSGVYDFIIFAKDLSSGAYGKERFTVVISNKAQVGQPPVISGVKGPTTLKVGEEGTWTIEASNQNSGSLNYKVIWGDEVYGLGAAKELAPRATPFKQTATFSRIYYRAGVYNPVFYIVNDRGQETKTSISVNVGGGYTAQPYYSAGPTGVTRGQSYNFYGKVSGGSPNSKVTLYLQRPDGTFKYSDQVVGNTSQDILVKGNNYTDSNGNWSSSAYQAVTFEGQNGTWTSWVSVGGIASNKVYHYVTSGVSGQPSIQVLSPNGGETWQVGKTYVISYYVPDTNAEPLIYLEKGYEEGSSKTGVNSSLLIGQPGRGVQSFSYTVPNGIASWPGLGSNYKVKVCVNNCASSDSSNTPFSIVAAGNSVCEQLESQIAALQKQYDVLQCSLPTASNTDICKQLQAQISVLQSQLTTQCKTAQPSINVLSPNGGESWTTGSAQIIRWSGGGNGYIGIYLYKWSTMSLSESVGRYSAPAYVVSPRGILASHGQFSWTIPNSVVTDQYYVRIGTPDGVYVDNSDAPFSIVSGTTKTSIDFAVGDMYLSQLSPQPNQDFTAYVTVSADPAKIPQESSVTARLNIYNTASGDRVYSAGTSVDKNLLLSTGKATVKFYTGMFNPEVNTATLRFPAGTYKFVADILDANNNDPIPSNDSRTLTITIGTTGSPSIAVLSPNGGETWQIGTKQIIRWSAPDYDVKYSIIVEDINGFGEGTIVDNYSSSLNQYDWTASSVYAESNIGRIPKSLESGQYKIRILNQYNGQADVSDAPFSIMAAPPPQ